MTGIIKVDTIQNNGGTTGLTIDSSGRVRQPALPSFHAYIYNSDSNPRFQTSGGTHNLVPFDTTTYNVGGGFSTSSKSFTAPIAGNYQFNVRVSPYNAAANEYLRIIVKDSGGTERRVLKHLFSDGNGDHMLASSTVLDMTAGEEVLVYILSSDSDYYVSRDARWSEWSGFLVG